MNSHFPLLQQYAKFLIELEKIDEFVELNIKLAQSLDLEILKAFTSEEQLKEYTKISFEKFLIDLSKGVAMKSAFESLEKWQSNEQVIPFTTISKHDLIMGYNIRKQVLLKYADQFSSHPQTYLDLIREIELLLSSIEYTALKFITGGK